MSKHSNKVKRKYLTLETPNGPVKVDIGSIIAMVVKREEGLLLLACESNLITMDFQEDYDRLTYTFIFLDKELEEYNKD